MATDRRAKVLNAIVQDYIKTGEPVGSRAVVERHHLGVSPATVRNDMAALEEASLIHQPHTSAGRVPRMQATASSSTRSPRSSRSRVPSVRLSSACSTKPWIWTRSSRGPFVCWPPSRTRWRWCSTLRYARPAPYRAGSARRKPPSWSSSRTPGVSAASSSLPPR